MLLHVLAQIWADAPVLSWLQEALGHRFVSVAWQQDDLLLSTATRSVVLHEGKALKLLGTVDSLVGAPALWSVLRTLDHRDETHDFLSCRAFAKRQPGIRFALRRQGFRAVVPLDVVPRRGTAVKALDRYAAVAILHFTPQVHAALHRYLVVRLHGPEVAKGPACPSSK
jgi:hypothetical protein